MDHLRYDDGERAVLTLDNPDSKNALSIEMADDIHEAIAAVPDSDTRCVVIQGAR